MNIKIKGWEKISGYTYKGHCIVNPIHNAGETKYMADVLDLNLPNRPKWELNVLAPGHKWKAVNDDRFHILLWDDSKFSTRKEVDKDMILSVSSFRTLFETLVDEMLELREEINAKLISNVTKRVNGGSSGIINTVTNSGTTISNTQFTNNTFVSTAMSEMVETIKNMEEQIAKLTKQINGGIK